jgi:glycerol-3-phosphate acyltransferase PlsY
MRLSMRLGFIVAALAYLLGSIPFGYILARVFLGTDVRTIGSGNIGATNVMRTGSKKLGIATLVLDAAKGYLAVALAIALASAGGLRPPDCPVYLFAGLAALFAILGHVFPVWLRFKGGKGVATGVGVFFALAPKAILIVLGIFALILAGSRYVSLASIIASAAFPFIAYAFADSERARTLLPFMCAASLLIIAKHHQNIRRLLSGSEHRFGSKKK